LPVDTKIPSFGANIQIEIQIPKFYQRRRQLQSQRLYNYCQYDVKIQAIEALDA
jgi:hypothetical protein